MIFGKLRRLAWFLVGVDVAKMRCPWQAEGETRDLKVIVDQQTSSLNI